MIEKINLDQCLYHAEELYSKRWTDKCTDLKMKIHCRLPIHTADAFEKRRDKEIDFCFRRYSFR